MRRAWASTALAIAIGVGWSLALGLAPGAGIVASAAEPAQLRVVHLVGGVSSLDVWVDGELLFEGVELRSVTRYVRLPAGEHRLRVRTAAGALDEGLALTGGEAHTVVLLSSGEGLRRVVLTDSFAHDPERAKVRFVQGLADYDGVGARLEGGIELARALPPLTAGDYVEVPPGSYDLEVRGGEGELLMRVRGLALSPQANYTMIVADLYGEGLPTTLFVVRDRPNPPVPAIIWAGLALWALLLVRFVVSHLP